MFYWSQWIKVAQKDLNTFIYLFGYEQYRTPYASAHAICSYKHQYDDTQLCFMKDKMSKTSRSTEAK